jgi:hypothetical protein
MACLEVLDVPFWGLKASPAILDVLYGGLGINVIFEQKNILFYKCNFLTTKHNFFVSGKFFQFLVIKTLDPDPH